MKGTNFVRVTPPGRTAALRATAIAWHERQRVGAGRARSDREACEVIRKLIGAQVKGSLHVLIHDTIMCSTVYWYECEYVVAH